MEIFHLATIENADTIEVAQSTESIQSVVRIIDFHP